jgi:ribosomal protein S18 acetylase RimI-like enzyme
LGNMKTDMDTRKATAEDAGQIARLNDAVQKIHAENHPHVFKYPTDASEIEAFFRQQIAAEADSIFIAADDGRAIGYVWCTIQRKRETPFKHGQDRIYIHQISVDPAYRRRGVGRRLMQAVDGLARIEDIHCVALDSWEFNAEAHAFFERLGFARYNVNMWRQTNGD